MKKTLFLILLFNISFGQNNFFVPIDYEKINEETNNPKSNLFVEKLKTKFYSKDSTMTDFEMKNFIYSFGIIDNSTIYEQNSKCMDSLNLLAKKTELDGHKMISLLKAIVTNNPVNFRAYQYLIQLSEKLNLDSSFYNNRLNQVVNVIKKTGDGTSIENGYEIVPIFDIEGFLMLNNLSLKNREDNNFDIKCEVENIDKNTKNVYFKLNPITKEIIHDKYVNDEFLTGIWATKILRNSSKNRKDILNELFEDSKIHFNKDKKVFIEVNNIKGNQAIKNQFLKMINSQKWIYSKDERRIKIGSKEDNYSTVQMFVYFEDKNDIMLQIKDIDLDIILRASRITQ